MPTDEQQLWPFPLCPGCESCAACVRLAVHQQVPHPPMVPGPRMHRGRPGCTGAGETSKATISEQFYQEPGLFPACLVAICFQWKWSPFTGYKESIPRTHLWRLWCGKIYLGGNRRQPPGSQFHLCPSLCERNSALSSSCPRIEPVSKNLGPLVQSVSLCSWLPSNGHVPRPGLSVPGLRQLLGLHGFLEAENSKIWVPTN